MIVLGIDPGTAITGYGFVKETLSGDIEIVSYGVITTSSSLSLDQRLLKIYHELKDLIFLHKPITGAVEDLFFQKNVKTALSVGHARGVVLLAMAECGVPFESYTPGEVKQAVTGYGGADKNQVQQMVRTLLNLPEIPKPDDAADALAVAICHAHSSRLLRLK